MIKIILDAAVLKYSNSQYDSVFKKTLKACEPPSILFPSFPLLMIASMKFGEESSICMSKSLIQKNDLGVGPVRGKRFQLTF